MWHEIRDGIIHKPMPCQSGFLSKEFAHNQHMKMPGALGCAGMTHMVLGLIPDLQALGGKSGLKAPLKLLAQAHGCRFSRSESSGCAKRLM